MIKIQVTIPCHNHEAQSSRANKRKRYEEQIRTPQTPHMKPDTQTKENCNRRPFVCHYWRRPILIKCMYIFVCSKMVDETNFSSKLPVADRTRELWGRKLCWWCLSPGFPLSTFLLGFADSVCFVFTTTPFNEATLLDPVKSVPTTVGMLKSLREALRVSLYRFFTMGTFSHL